MMTQHACEGAPQSGVGTFVMRQSIGTDHAQGVSKNAAHIIFMHLKIAGSSWHQSTTSLLLICSPFLCNITQVTSCHFRMSLAASDQNVDDTIHQIFTQQSRACAVGVDIGTYVLTMAEPFKHGQRFDGAAPVAWPCTFVVRHDPCGWACQRRVGRLLHG